MPQKCLPTPLCYLDLGSQDPPLFPGLVRTVKAYSSNCDIKARWPQKNVTDVTPAALDACHVEDKFTHMILGAPTVDITNLDTSKLTDLDNIDVYKQKTIISCQNILTVAQNAIAKHPNLNRY